MPTITKTIEEYYEDCPICKKRVSGERTQVRHNMDVHKMTHNKKDGKDNTKEYGYRRARDGFGYSGIALYRAGKCWRQDYQETQKKIQGLQMLEQGYQNIVFQKQSFQVEVNETNTALSEVEKSKSDVFRVLGQVMVKADKNSLKKELKEKSDLLNLRMKTVERQELQMREEIERLRSEIMDKVKWLKFSPLWYIKIYRKILILFC